MSRDQYDITAVAKLAMPEKLNDYEELRRTVGFVPTEILEAARQMQRINRYHPVETIVKGE